MSEEIQALVAVLAAGGGLLLTLGSLVIIFLKLVRGWIDKAMAKHFYHEHVLDPGTGETVMRRLIRCDTNCPVLHPPRGGGEA
jgi:hypothetical protein